MIIRGIVIASAFGYAALQPAVTVLGVDFNRDVLPLLSDKCFKCHGPDAAQRQAELRLDDENSARESGVFASGEVDESELLRRISSADPEERMPPPDSGLELSRDEVEVLQRWIEDGAPYERHWSLVPLQEISPPPPDRSFRDWVCNPIDAFVARRFREQAVSPAPRAPRETLIRRLSFDLTGLPPTPEQIDDYLAAAAPGAYERVVQRLLDSPHYGERMARQWLDLARYAETHGYQSDDYRPAWPWRDWVIRALNNNMPFDDFVTYQLAGDLLAREAASSAGDATPSWNPSSPLAREQIIATAFCRNHAQNSEGGIVLEEFRVEYVADRTHTFGTAFLGLTLECCRCHDHKFDPVSQKEFYQLFSFFNNVPESGQITWNTRDVPGPTLLLPTAEEQEQLTEIEAQIANVVKEAAKYRQSQQEVFDTWLRDRGESPHRGDPAAFPDLVAHFSFDHISNQEIRNNVDGRVVGRYVDPVTEEVSDADPIATAGRVGQALLFSGDDALFFFPQEDEQHGIGRFHRGQPFSIGLWIWIPEALQYGVIFHNNKGGVLYTFKGYQASIEAGRLDIRLAHDFPANCLHLTSRAPLPKERWLHLLLTYDGSSRASGVDVYLNGQAAEMEVHRDHLYKDIVFRLHDNRDSKERPLPTYLKVGGRWRTKGFSEGRVDEMVVYDRRLTTLEAAHLARAEDFSIALESPIEELSDQQRGQLLETFLACHDPVYRQMLAELEKLRDKQAELVEPVLELMVMEETPQPRKAFVLRRGAYDAPTQPVQPGTPSAILKFPAGLPKDRRGLAQWLFLPTNPLTARVAVNRYWQLFFGRGIVATLEDFGSQGKRPTHPELLDWLAQEFISSGWDVKALCRLIVTSATYRQAAHASSAVYAADPDNILLARGPAGRLTAEQVRDNALAISGLLVRKIGGPSVKPYQPEGLWSLNSMSGPYQQDTGDSLYRRSLYTFWKRTNPPPSMNIFDAPNRSYCVVRRETTSTPLQALVLLNDTQYVEAARALAQRLVRQHADDVEARIIAGFRTATSRAPSPGEISVLARIYQQQLSYFRQHPARAGEYLSTGESSLDAELDQLDLAATSVVATALLNLPETTAKP